MTGPGSRTGSKAQPQPASPAPPGRTALLCGAALGASSLLTGMLGLGRGDQFPGRLSAVSHPVVAPVDSTVSEVLGTPGRTVRDGIDLFQLQATSLQQQLDQQRLEVVRLNSELHQVTARCELETTHRLSDIDSSRFATEQTLTGLLHDLFRLQFETAVSARSPYWDALAGTELPQVDLKSIAGSSALPFEVPHIRNVLEQGQQQNTLETVQARIELCERRLEELQTLRAQVTGKVQAALGLVEIQQKLDAAQQQVTALEAEPMAVTLASPAYGMIGHIQVKPNEKVAQGTVLCELFDRDQELVETAMPAEMGARLRTGMPVRVLFPGGEERDGEVQTVPAQVASLSDHNATINVTVRAVGRVWPNLPLGSTVQVVVE